MAPLTAPQPAFTHQQLWHTGVMPLEDVSPCYSHVAILRIRIRSRRWILPIPFNMPRPDDTHTVRRIEDRLVRGAT